MQYWKGERVCEVLSCSDTRKQGMKATGFHGRAGTDPSPRHAGQEAARRDCTSLSTLSHALTTSPQRTKSKYNCLTGN